MCRTCQLTIILNVICADIFPCPNFSAFGLLSIHGFYAVPLKMALDICSQIFSSAVFFFCSYYTLLCPLQEFIHPLFMLNSGLNECLVAIKLSSYVLTKPQSFVKLMVKRHVLTDGGMNLLHCFMHLFVKFSDENVLEVFHTYFSLAVFRVGDSCTAIYMPSWTSNWWLNILDWKMS